MNVRPFRTEDEAELVALWQRCGLTRAWNDPVKDIHRKLRVQAELFLVGTVDGQIIGSVMAGYEGHRGWINYLAVDPAYRHQGHAKLLMEHAERLLRAAGCPKINIQVRADNEDVIKFYQNLDYNLEDVVNMGKRLQHDNSTPK